MNKEKIEEDMRKCQTVFPELFDLLNRLMQSNRKEISELKLKIELKDRTIISLMEKGKVQLWVDLKLIGWLY